MTECEPSRRPVGRPRRRSVGETWGGCRAESGGGRAGERVDSAGCRCARGGGVPTAPGGTRLTERARLGSVPAAVAFVALAGTFGSLVAAMVIGWQGGSAAAVAGSLAVGLPLVVGWWVLATVLAVPAAAAGAWVGSRGPGRSQAGGRRWPGIAPAGLAGGVVGLVGGVVAAVVAVAVAPALAAGVAGASVRGVGGRIWTVHLIVLLFGFGSLVPAVAGAALGLVIGRRLDAGAQSDVAGALGGPRLVGAGPGPGDAA